MRTILGRKVKTLRKAGILPATVFGKKIDSISIQVNQKSFGEVFKKAGETSIVDLDFGSDSRPVLINNISLHPVLGTPIHVDFLQVDLKSKIEANIPVEMKGESPAEKSGIGTVLTQINEVRVEALPTDLPEKFVVDLSKLTEVEQTIFVKDLDWDRGKVEMKSDLEQIVVKVEPPQKEEVVEAPVTTEAVAPVEGESAAEVKPEDTTSSTS